MKKWNGTEEELQRLIEQELKGTPVKGYTITGEDAALYRTLFKAMADPRVITSFAIEETVIHTIAKKQDNWDRFYIILLGTIYCGIALLTGIVALMIVNASLIEQLITILEDHKLIIISFLLLILCNRVFDHFFVKKLA